MGIKESIDDTRKGFEESFATGDFYNRQTQDSDHLEKILGFVKISKGMKILDLGCGSGYLSFPIAKNNPDCDRTLRRLANPVRKGSSGLVFSFEPLFEPLCQMDKCHKK